MRDLRTPTTGKVLKVRLEEEPLRLRSPGTVEQQQQEVSESIIAQAQRAADRIRREALNYAEGERQAARQEAAAIIQDAEAQREQLFQETRQEAIQQARQEVMNEFRPRLEETVNQFERLLNSAAAALSQCLEDHKNEMVGLAVAIAEKVMRKIQKEDRELVLRTVEAAIEQARERQRLIVRVNPDDLKILDLYKQNLLERFTEIQSLKLETDRRVDRGGAWIETPSGFIDAQIARQIEEILNSVLPSEENPWREKVHATNNDA